MAANNQKTKGETPQPVDQEQINVVGTTPIIVTPATIRAQIEDWKRRPVTLGSSSGYFVDKKALHECCDFVDEQLAATNGRKDWQSISDELDILRQEAKIANNIITQLRQQNNEAFEHAKSVQSVEGERVAELTADLADARHAKADLQEQLSAAKQALADRTADLKTAGKGYDLDLVQEIAQLRNSTAEDVKAIQAELSDANKQIKLLTKSKKDSEKAIKDSSDELAGVRRALDAANKLKSESFGKDTELPKVKLPVIRTPIVQRLIGDKGLRWLQQAETTVRNDYKDRALKLMSAARSSNDKNLKSLGDLLELIFKWLKTQTYRARSVVADWLSEIEADLRRATVKNISHYRDSLKKLRDEHKLRILNLRDGKAEKEFLDRGELPPKNAGDGDEFAPTMFENAWIWVRVLSTRVKRIFVPAPKAPVGTRSPAQKVFDKIRSFANRVSGWFSFEFLNYHATVLGVDGPAEGQENIEMFDNSGSSSS